MRMGIAALAGLVVATASSGASAQKIDCNKAVSTAEMQECANRDYEKEDKRLNRVYQQFMKADALDDQGRNLLKDAQRKWIQYRDAKCSFEADAWRGGTGASQLFLACMGNATKLRADELEEDLKQR